MIFIQQISFGQTCRYVTNISWKSLIYQAFEDVSISLAIIFISQVSIYNEEITIQTLLQKIIFSNPFS